MGYHLPLEFDRIRCGGGFLSLIARRLGLRMGLDVAVGPEDTESIFGKKQSTMVTDTDDGTSIHVLAESGVALTASARLIRLTVNDDFTDSGVSEVSIPDIEFTTFDQQGEDAPRIWEHRLALLAQKMIDEGNRDRTI